MRTRILVPFLAAALAVGARTSAQEQWRLISPANTGIPGSDVNFARVDGNDDVWVSGRYAFWSDGGIARFDGTKWDTYSNFDTPMPSQWVYSAAFGPGGTRWYGTGGGLVRHQGDDWQIFDSANSPLPTDDVTGTVVDATGAVWMKYFKSGGFLTKGVARYDGTSWQTWDRTEIGFAVASDFTGPVVDGQGRVWVGSTTGGTEQSGMAVYDGSTWTLSNAATGTSNAPVGNLRVDPSGDVWCFWWLGVQKLVGSEWVAMPSPPTTDSIASFEPRSGQSYWVGTHSGFLLEYDGAQWIQHGPGAPTFPSWVLSIDWDSAGNLWVGTLKAGVWFLDAATSVWKQYTGQNTGLPTYFIDGITTTASGHAWFACAGGGAAELSGTAADLTGGIWRCFNAVNSGTEPWPWDFTQPYGNDSANDVLADGQGGVWVSSSGVAHWDGSASFDQLFVSQNSDVWTNLGDKRLGLDSAGNLWVGYDLYGVDRYDGQGWKHFGLGEGLPGNFVDDIATDPSGGVYAATNGGLGHFDGEAWSTLPAPPGLPFSITSVAVGTDGHVWAGTSGGVARWNGTEWIATYTEADGLPANPVNDIAVAPNGDVWVGAFEGQIWPYYGGVSRFDGQAWTKYDSSNSPMRHEQVEEVHVDAQGNVWISTMSEGIAVLLAGDQTLCQEDLGFGGPGTAQLTLCGEPLTATGQATMSLVGAAPAAPAFLLYGLGQGAVPLVGGTVVPVPTLYVGPFPTDLQGELHIPITGFGLQFDLYVQYAIYDPAQAESFALSNAVKIEFL